KLDCGYLDLIDFLLCAGFNTKAVPVLIQKSFRSQIMLCQPPDESLIRTAPSISAVDDEVEISVLAFVDGAHSRPRHAAAGEMTAASFQVRPVCRPEGGSMGQGP